MFKSLRSKLDPLDLEILERTFDATWAKAGGNDGSDEGLESMLRRELIEMACSVLYGVSDPEALRDILSAASETQAPAVPDEPRPRRPEPAPGSSTRESYERRLREIQSAPGKAHRAHAD